MVRDKTRLLCHVLNELFPQREVFQFLSQSEGVKHGKEIVEQVPGRDVDKRH